MSGWGYLAGGLLEGAGSGLTEVANTKVAEEVAKAKALREDNLALKLHNWDVERDKTQNELADTRQKNQWGHEDASAEDQRIWEASQADSMWNKKMEYDRQQHSQGLLEEANRRQWELDHRTGPAPSDYDKRVANAKSLYDQKLISQQDFINVVKGDKGESGPSSMELRKQLAKEANDKGLIGEEYDQYVKDGLSSFGGSSTPKNVEMRSQELNAFAKDLLQVPVDERESAIEELASKYGEETTKNIISQAKSLASGIPSNDLRERSIAKRAASNKEESVKDRKLRESRGEIPRSLDNMTPSEKANVQKWAKFNGVTVEQFLLDEQKRKKIGR